MNLGSGSLGAEATTTILTLLILTTRTTTLLTLLFTLTLITTGILIRLGNGGGNGSLGQVQVTPQILNTGVSQEVVVVLPVELLGDVATGLEGNEALDDLQVVDGDFLVGEGPDVLLDHHDALLEEVLVDELDVSFGNEHHFRLV